MNINSTLQLKKVERCKIWAVFISGGPPLLWAELMSGMEWKSSLIDENWSGVKKNTCGSGSWPTLFFSADLIIFSTRLTVRPYFLRVVAGCCQNGVCCHTNSLKKPWKKYLKKIISDLPWLYEDRRRWKTDDDEGGNDDHDGQLLESEYWWRFRRRHFEEQWCFDKEQITQSESGNLFVLFRFSS
jgi:hypothetical protein